MTISVYRRAMIAVNEEAIFMHGAEFVSMLLISGVRAVWPPPKSRALAFNDRDRGGGGGGGARISGDMGIL